MSTNSTPGQTPKRTVLTISIDQIDLADTQFQVRESIDEGKLKEYEQILRDSGSHDLSAFRSRPLVWKRPDQRYAILDGGHRCHAAKAAGITRFEVEVLAADQTEATIQAMKANLSHGLPLKPQERMEACFRTFQVLTKNGIQPSNQTVAELLGVHEGTIRNYKEQLEVAGKLTPALKVVGKDGKIQAAKKARTKKPAVGPATPSKPETEGSTASKSSSPSGRSVLRSNGPPMNVSCGEFDRLISTPKPALTPANTPCSSSDLNILRRGVEILHGLDAKAWNKCPDREKLASLVSELVEAGNAALKAKGALKAGVKAA